MEQVNQKLCCFFDQNVLKPMSKNKDRYLQFQKNVKHILPQGKFNIALPSFSFLEFVGIQVKKNIFNISYEGKRLEEYACKYKELKDLTSYLKNHIEEKITKPSLQKRLSDKKCCESEYLTDLGNSLIEEYRTHYLCNDNFFYNNMIDNLYLDRLLQINTSKFSLEEKINFNHYFYYPRIMKNVCDKRRTMGSFRAIQKMIDDICRQINTNFKNDIPLNKNRKETVQILNNLKLKPNSDLVDCELIHLSFFGYDDHYCHCYTTDQEDLIKKRLNFYCESIYAMEIYFYEILHIKRPDWADYCKKHFPKQRPKWQCGEIFILDKATGKPITKISVAEIYKKIKHQIDKNRVELLKVDR